ncbi:MAG: Rieske 2Fe-2S domain-containing protein [Candidatus Micrarchaeales archaeon]|nr:Rieske 2Fe-2S domain-containing protein [Candidatus Micrarchaeales archaeon]
MAGVKLSIKKSDLVEKKPVKVDVDGKHVFLVMIDGKLFAMDEVCSHRGGPLEKGALDGYNIKCPWHGAIYDVRTGKVSSSTPWGKGQAAYKVNVDASGAITLEM